MARGDISPIGINGGAQEFRVAASATRGYAGDPINSLAALTSGESDVNTVVVLTTAKPVIGTDNFIGIASKNMEVNSSGTVIAHRLWVVVPIPYVTRLRGRATTASEIDTDSELLGLFFDATVFTLTSGAYTILSNPTTNTHGLIIRDGNISLGTLDVAVDARVMRNTVA